MDTLGWDTVYAVSLDHVNAALRASASRLPSKWVGSNDASSHLTYTLDAISNSWQLEQGHSGALLDLVITFESGTITVLGQSGSLAGVVVAVKVDLRFLPSTVPGGRDVAFEFTAPQSTSAGELRTGREHLPALVAAMTPTVIAAYLAAHAGAITYALATVNPAPPGQTWMQPAASAFTTLKDSGSGRVFLTILSVVTPRDISSLNRSVPLSLPGPAEAVYVLSQDLVMSRMIMPALASAFGVDAGKLAFNGGGHAIESRESWGLGGVKSGAVYYYPQLRGLRTTLDNDVLVTAIHGDCSLYLNIAMTFGVQTRCPFRFSASSQTMSFVADPSPQSSKDVSIPWYDWFLGPVADLIMAIVVKVVSDDLGSKVSEAVSSETSLQQVTNLVTWSGPTHPHLTTARLESSLLLTGTF